jgi:NADH-quinone oxidoreductase subunit I
MIRAIWENLKGLWTLLVGMKITLEYLLSPTLTVHYPRDMVEPENVANFRGPVELTRGKEDPSKTNCISCQLCVRACPSECLTVIKGKEGKAPGTWICDFSYCSLCGGCVEACPADAIAFSHKVYLVSTTREALKLDLLADLAERTKNAPKPKERPLAAMAAKAPEKPAAKAPEKPAAPALEKTDAKAPEKPAPKA